MFVRLAACEMGQAQFMETIMDVPAGEEQIQTLAYWLWKEAGSPDGRSDEFWLLAQHQLAKEPRMGDTVPAAPADNPASES
ncbi:DUF2934 domain-containing protein [Caballeronia pedi]